MTSHHGIGIGGLYDGSIKRGLDRLGQEHRLYPVLIARRPHCPPLPPERGQVEHHLHLTKPDPHRSKGRAAVIGQRCNAQDFGL